MHSLLNLDPGNEDTLYDCDIDIQDLVKVSEVMEELKLGPNGSLLYCFDFIEENKNWLMEKFEQLENRTFIIDMPGQVELYINSDKICSLLGEIRSKYQNCLIVQLFDSFMSKVKSV